MEQKTLQILLLFCFSSRLSARAEGRRLTAPSFARAAFCALPQDQAQIAKGVLKV